MTEFTKIKVTKEFLESLQGYGASKKNNKVKIKSKTPTSISERNKNITNSDEEENIENKKNNTHEDSAATSTQSNDNTIKKEETPSSQTMVDVSNDKEKPVEAEQTVSDKITETVETEQTSQHNEIKFEPEIKNKNTHKEDKDYEENVNKKDIDKQTNEDNNPEEKQHKYEVEEINGMLNVKKYRDKRGRVFGWLSYEDGIGLKTKKKKNN